MSTPNPLDQTRSCLRVAAEPTRLQLLLHASTNAHVAPDDARRYATLSPGGGTGQYHIGELVQAGLLLRQAHGRYILTGAGMLIVQLHDLLQNVRLDPDAIEIAVWSDSSVFDELFPEGSELHLDLVRRLSGGSRDNQRVRVARGLAP